MDDMMVFNGGSYQLSEMQDGDSTRHFICVYSMGETDPGGTG